MSRILNLNSKY